MNQQTTRPSRESRAVELLTGGEHINHQVHQHDDVLTWQVGHVAPYTDDNSVPMVAVMLAPLGGGEPELVRERRGVTVPIATESEVASAKAEGHRFAVASALRQVADDILNHRLPVPNYSFTVSGVLGSRDELERWAKHLDVEIRMSGDIPVIDKEVGGLRVHFQSNPEPAAPKPLQVDSAIAAAEALEPKDTGRVAECGCHIFQDPLVDDPEVIHDTACQDWYFTFGSGHTHPESPAVNAEGGESLADRYVVIRGTCESARAIMLRFFGRVWCDQYETAEKAGVERFGLTELARRHWPTPAVEVAATDAQSGA